MEVIWVIENVLKTQEFYNRRRLSLLIASISLWKKYHPNHFTVLYCDKETHEVLNNLNVLHLWDEIRDLSYPEKIQRKYFWSSCKSKVISETTESLVVVDHDFLIFTNIDEHLRDKVLYSYNEEAYPWYPSKYDKWCLQLSDPVDIVVDLSANVSLLYLPDPNFAKKYAKRVLKNHVEFSAMENFEITNANYMIFSEQLMLKQMLVKENIPHNTLVSNVYDNNKSMFSDVVNKHGIWNCEEISLYYKHYGVLEEQIDQTELDYIFRCINASKKVDIKKLKNKLYESYPC